MKQRLSFAAVLGICFFASINASHAQVRADTGGIAIGGSVTGSTINIGVPPKQLAALVRQANDLSETQKKVIANGVAQDFIAQSGAPASAFPKPDRSVANIVSPIWHDEKERDDAGEPGQLVSPG